MAEFSCCDNIPESERFERRAVVQDGPAVPIPSFGRSTGLPCGGGLHHGPYGVPCDSRMGVSLQQSSPRTPRSPRAERRRSRNSRPETPSNRPDPDTGKEADYSSVPMAGLYLIKFSGFQFAISGLPLMGAMFGLCLGGPVGLLAGVKIWFPFPPEMTHHNCR